MWTPCGATVWFPAEEAVVGFLALTDYEKTDLEGPLELQGNYGSVPIAVRLPGRPGRTRPIN